MISLSEKLYPVEIKKVDNNLTKKPKELSLLKSTFQKKKCLKKIETAVINGDLEYVKNYVDNGENINCQGKWKQSLLMKAISSEKEEIALFLMNNGANIKSVDDENNTALFNTGYSGLVKVANVLIEKGALINKKCSRDMTPLMNASNRNHLELVKLLVENGAIINTQCKDGYTALTYTSNPKIVQFLLSKGADIKLKSFQGLNALEQVKNKFEEIKNYGTKEMINNEKRIIEIIGKY